MSKAKIEAQRSVLMIIVYSDETLRPRRRGRNRSFAFFVYVVRELRDIF